MWRVQGAGCVWIIILIVPAELIPRYAFAMLEEKGIQIIALHERWKCQPLFFSPIPLYFLDLPPHCPGGGNLGCLSAPFPSAPVNVVALLNSGLGLLKLGLSKLDTSTVDLLLDDDDDGGALGVPPLEYGVLAPDLPPAGNPT